MEAAQMERVETLKRRKKKGGKMDGMEREREKMWKSRVMKLWMKQTKEERIGGKKEQETYRRRIPEIKKKLEWMRN